MTGGVWFKLLDLVKNLVAQPKKGQSDKMAFAKELIRKQEEERKKFSREFNNGVEATIKSLRIEIDKTTEIALENQRLIRTGLEEVRSISKCLELL